MEHSSPTANSGGGGGGRLHAVLRPVTEVDEPFLRRLYRSTRGDLTGAPQLDAAQLGPLLDLQFRAQQADYARGFPAADYNVVLVADAPAGRLSVNRGGGILRVVDVSMLPEYRGRGIGTMLLRDLQDEADRLGAVVRLHVRPGGGAEALYRRLGFLPLRRSGTECPGFDEGLDIEMEWRPEHWLPIHIQPRRPCALVDWFDAGQERLVDPFFVQAFQRVEAKGSRSPGRPVRRMGSIDELVAEAADAPGLAPSGFVLHMSRCGSTLLSQMLAADPENLVLSEPPAVDGVLRTLFTCGVSEELAVAWLRAVIGVLGRPRHGERRLFVKFDAWHTTQLSLLRRAFPETPWVFVYRDPLEVLVSHERRTAGFVVPGAVPTEAFGLKLATAVTMLAENYAGAVLSAICRAALGGLDAAGKLVDYEELPAALADVLSHFGVTVDAERLALMESAGHWDAKSPTLRFVPDGPGKRAEADERLRAAAADMADVVAALAAARNDGVSGREAEPTRATLMPAMSGALAVLRGGG
jgi:ribosomal protein S18 acetylase RimI-like enzyme